MRPLLAADNTHDWVGPAAAARGGSVPSTFELTDDERQLRDLAFPLIEPPYDRQKWDSVLREYGVLGKYQAAPSIAPPMPRKLLVAQYRSPASRYAQLTDDIRNDITRAPDFFETASRVIDVDDKRRKSLCVCLASSAPTSAPMPAAEPRKRAHPRLGARHARPAGSVLSLRARAAGDHDAVAGGRSGGADAQSSARGRGSLPHGLPPPFASRAVTAY